MTAPLVYDLSPEAWTERLAQWGEPAYRLGQIWRHLYVNLTTSAAEMTDLPVGLRQGLAQAFRFSGLEESASAASRSGDTEKTLYRLWDGNAIEAVLMLYERRRTACISSQAGCAMGCSFCATGQMGFRRNLSSGEIVEQALRIARRLRRSGTSLTNLVVMGMGEPFHNYQATVDALDRLNDPGGFAFGARRMTVSTVGVVPMIDRFAEEEHQYNLAVSLHAADDTLRDKLVPLNRRYPLQTLMDACRRYVGRTRRRITFEWALIEGVNDMPEQGHALCAWLRGMTCHVNLIPLNPTDGFGGKASPPARAKAFLEILERAGIPATLRRRRGIEIRAGCGQLASSEIPPAEREASAAEAP